MKNYALMALVLFASTGCATYNYAEQVKMVSFSEDLKKGTSVGSIRGEDCTWSIGGYQMGGLPTIDRAFINAKNQASGLESAGMIGEMTGAKKNRGEALRYVNNVHTANEGFNALIVGKKCIVVSGLGYK